MSVSSVDYVARQNRITGMLDQAGLKALAINAGSNLTYLTGLTFDRMERPTIALLAPGMPVTLVLPGFEVGKTHDLPYPVQTFSYEDNPSSWPAAFKKAAAATKLPGSQIGVESRELRVFELRLLETAAPGAVFPSADHILSSLRLIKDQDEIDAMQKAVDIAEQAFLATIPQVRIGMTELELASILTMQLLLAGSDSDIAFKPIIASGPNGANPHATPGSRQLESGDVVIMDWGARHKGYISDLSRTVVLGRCDPEMSKIAEIVLEATIAGCQVIRPGIMAGEVDRAAREVINQAGYGPYFRNRTGHGIGLDVHEEPYLFGENTQALLPGMAFTVEPGIYLDGRAGVRIEDNVVVSENGVKILSSLPRDLIEVGA